MRGLGLGLNLHKNQISSIDYMAKFNAPNGTLLENYVPDKGPKMTLKSGTSLVIQNNAVVNPNNTINIEAAPIAIDFLATFTATCINGAAMAMVGRYYSGNYYFFCGVTSTSGLVLQQYVNGVAMSYVNVANIFPSGTMHTFQWRMQQDKVKLVVDGSVYYDGTVNDISHLSSQTGFRGNAAATASSITNVTVQKI